MTEEIQRLAVQSIVPENCSGIVNELIDRFGMEECKRAFDDFGDLRPFLKQLDNMDAAKRLMHCIYTILPPEYDGAYRATAMTLFTKQAIVDALNGGSDMQQGLQSAINFFTKHEELSMFILNGIFEVTLEMTIPQKKDAYSMTDEADEVEEAVDQIRRMNDQIPIQHIDKGFKLYHGTSMDNYQQILQDGKIKASDYSEFDSRTDNYSKVGQAVYDTEHGYLFLDSGLDRPIAYGRGGYTKNHIPFHEVTEEESTANKNNSLLESEGVIFVIDPTNYDLYFNTGQSEFMIKGDVALEDTVIIFVHVKEGLITLTNEQGEQIDDICNE